MIEDELMIKNMMVYWVHNFEQLCVRRVTLWCLTDMNLWHQAWYILICTQCLKGKHVVIFKNTCLYIFNLKICLPTELNKGDFQVLACVGKQSKQSVFGPWPSMISTVWKQPLVFAQMLQCKLCLQGQGWVPLCSPLHSYTGNALLEPGRTRRLSQHI